jgi:hypothetical protein
MAINMAHIEKTACKQFLLNKAAEISRLKRNELPEQTDDILNATYILCNMINECADNHDYELVGGFCLNMRNIFNDFLTGRYSELADTSNILVEVLGNNFVSAPTPLDFIWDLMNKMDQPELEIMRICRLLLIKSFTNENIYKYGYSTIGASLFLIACLCCNKIYDVFINISQKASNIKSCQTEIITFKPKDLSDILPHVTIEDVELFSQNFNISSSKSRTISRLKLINFSKVVKNAPIIGKGSFGEVRQVIINNDKCAIKIFEDTGDCLAELGMVSKLSHLNISTPIAFSQKGKSIAYKCADISLDKYISYVKTKISNDLVQSYSFQLAKAIEYCHSKRIVHLDIKPGNILLYKDGLLQLTDFGSSMFIHHNYQGDNFLGRTTIMYVPPECCDSTQKCDPFSIDMWSLGCVIYQMFTLEYIMDPKICEIDDNEQADATRNRILDLGKTGLPDHIEKDAQDLIFGLLELDPNKRMKISDVLNNNFLRAIAPRMKNRFGYV